MYGWAGAQLAQPREASEPRVQLHELQGELEVERAQPLAVLQQRRGLEQDGAAATGQHRRRGGTTVRQVDEEVSDEEEEVVALLHLSLPPLTLRVDELGGTVHREQPLDELLDQRGVGLC